MDELLTRDTRSDKIAKYSNRLLASILVFQILIFTGLIFMGVIFYKIYITVDTVKDNLVNKGDSVTANIGVIADAVKSVMSCIEGICK